MDGRVIVEVGGYKIISAEGVLMETPATRYYNVDGANVPRFDLAYGAALDAFGQTVGGGGAVGTGDQGKSKGR